MQKNKQTNKQTKNKQKKKQEQKTKQQQRKNNKQNKTKTKTKTKKNPLSLSLRNLHQKCLSYLCFFTQVVICMSHTWEGRICFISKVLKCLFIMWKSLSRVANHAFCTGMRSFWMICTFMPESRKQKWRHGLNSNINWLLRYHKCIPGIHRHTALHLNTVSLITHLGNCCLNTFYKIISLLQTLFKK